MNTKERLEAARRELEAAQAAYDAECRQWEPEGGRFVVAPDGDIVEMPVVSDFQGRFFGTERPTRQLAEQARDAMRVHNRALAYVHEHAPGWDGTRAWEVIQDTAGRYTATSAACMPAVGSVTGPRHVMEQLADDLNNGRVKL